MDLAEGGAGKPPNPHFAEKIINLVKYISKNEVLLLDNSGRLKLADLAGKLQSMTE